MKRAITRDVGPAIVRCALTHREREPIDVDRARDQHRRYEALLSELGCTVVRLPAEPELPDAVFVEDTAIVLDEIAVIARPGAATRRDEIPTVEALLRDHRSLVRIAPPGTLDGGDVLIIGNTVHVGLSSRTNREGIEQLGTILSPFGYEVRAIPVTKCLHLKSAATRVAERTVLINPQWVEAGRLEGFEDLRTIEIDPSEPWGANALLIGSTIVHPVEHPRTRRRLEERGLHVEPIDLSELAKAEGSVTCCSLVFEDPSPDRRS